MTQNPEKLSPKAYASDQDVRWCPGCGDYGILKQAQSVLADIGVDRENTVFISGIGCSSRFPYYMDTYGMHSIHGRAPAVASGLKAANPNLSVWIVTGDGDGLSIGGNHLIHALRRNFDVNILLFNNEIYGLTKGQYSPTTGIGKSTKSSPLGVIDHPFNPLALALGADASFVARTVDRDPLHLRETLKSANEHKGSSFIEIYQNCNVFNDGAFSLWTDKTTKSAKGVQLVEGEALKFDNETKAIILEGLEPKVIDSKDLNDSNAWIHDSSDRTKAGILSRFFEHPENEDYYFPRAFGVLYKEDRICYEDAMSEQVQKAKELKPNAKLDDLLRGSNSWTV